MQAALIKKKKPLVGKKKRENGNGLHNGHDQGRREQNEKTGLVLEKKNHLLRKKSLRAEKLWKRSRISSPKKKSNPQRQGLKKGVDSNNVLGWKKKEGGEKSRGEWTPDA